MIDKIAAIVASVAEIFKSTKRNEKVIEERAQKLDIKNRVREVKAEKKVLKVERRINRIKDKMN